MVHIISDLRLSCTEQGLWSSMISTYTAMHYLGNNHFRNVSVSFAYYRVGFLSLFSDKTLTRHDNMRNQHMSDKKQERLCFRELLRSLCWLYFLFYFFFWCSPFISYVLWALYACLCSVPFSPIPPCLWIVYSGLPLRVSLIFICFVLVWEGASVLVDINLYSILDFPHL